MKLFAQSFFEDWKYSVYFFFSTFHLQNFKSFLFLFFFFFLKKKQKLLPVVQNKSSVSQKAASYFAICFLQSENPPRLSVTQIQTLINSSQQAITEFINSKGEVPTGDIDILVSLLKNQNHFFANSENWQIYYTPESIVKTLSKLLNHFSFVENDYGAKAHIRAIFDLKVSLFSFPYLESLI